MKQVAGRVALVILVLAELWLLTSFLPQPWSTGSVNSRLPIDRSLISVQRAAIRRFCISLTTAPRVSGKLSGLHQSAARPF